MLINSVDPDVADQPELLIACRELGSVAADWTALGTIVDSLRSLPSDATSLVQQGKLAGVVHTGEDLPRALILDSAPAAGWISIGPQAFLPKAYEAFSAAKQKYFAGELAGKLIACPGMAGPRAALALAATMNGAAFLGIDADSERIKRCVKTGYCDVMVNDLDEGLRILKNAARRHEAASVGLIGRPAEVALEMASRGVVPDLLADFSPSRDRETLNAPQRGIRDLQQLGSIVLNPVTSENAAGSIHWVALSGDATDIQRLDRLLLELFPGDEPLSRWIRTLQRRVRHQGLPARACSLSGEQRSRFGVAVNRVVRSGDVKAPIVIVRRLRTHANGESESQKKTESDAPSGNQLSALIKLSGGATWASIDRDEHGKAHVTAQAIVADGASEMDARIEHVLNARSLPAT